MMENHEAAAKFKMPLVLIGMMGSGKSTLGSALARAFQRKFYDTDQVIERETGKTISAIFQEQGEPAFRVLERETIARLMTGSEPAVIATGGGAITVPETADLIFGKSLSLWIDAPIATLVDRTSREQTRPLLKTGDPAEILGALFEKRGNIYARATLRVINDKAPVDEMTVRTVRQIEEYLQEQDRHATGH
jgi:shikimate kinase